ncbi:MAG: hypothetical protein DRQ78_09540, partial [Epsilonproteobacteria bacterium]
ETYTSNPPKIDPVEKNTEDNIDMKKLRDKFNSNQMSVRHSGVVGYDTNGQIVDNLRHAKFLAYKKKKSEKDQSYEMVNRFTGKTLPMASGSLPFQTIGHFNSIQRKNGVDSEKRQNITDYDKTKKRKDELPLKDGDMIAVSSKIDAGKKKIEWDHNPATVEDRSGPDLPLEPTSAVRYKKTGTFTDENMTYDTVDVSFDNGKTWTSTRPDGKPTIIIHEISGPGMNEGTVNKHAEANMDNKEIYEKPTINAVRTGRLTTIDKQYDASKDTGTVEYQQSQEDISNQELNEATETISKAENPFDDNFETTLESSEAASDILTKGSYEPLTADNIVDWAKSIATWDNSLEKDTGFYLNVLREIVSPSLDAASELEIQVGVNETGDNMGSITFGPDGEPQQINMYQSAQQKNSAVPLPHVGQSMIEIYTHEMMHAVTAYLLDGTNAKYINRRMITKYFETAKRETTFEDFLQRDENGNIVYPINKNQEILDAKAKWKYIFENKKGNGIHEFVSYGLTNKRFASKLGTIRIKRETKGGSTLFQKMMNWAKDAIVNIFSKRVDKDYNVDINTAMKKMVLQMNKTQSGRQNFLNKMLTNAAGFLRKADIAGNIKMKNLIDHQGVTNVVTSTQKGTKKFFSRLYNVTRIPHLIQQDTPVGKALRRIARNSGWDERGLFASVLNTVISDGKDMKAFTEQGLKNKSNIDRKREEAGAALRRLLHEEYDRELTEEENQALQIIGIETDISFLTTIMDESSETNIYTAEELVRILREPARLKARIENAKRTLRKQPGGDIMVRQSVGLGNVMAQGKNGVVGQLMNANMIARNGSSTNPVKTANPETEAMVDTLATLVAIEKSTDSMVETMANLLDNDTSATMFFLRQHNAQKEKAISENFRSNADGNINKTQTIKGYSKDLTNPDIDVEFIEKSAINDQKMDHKGYKLEKTIHSTTTGKTMNIWSSDEGSQGGYNPGMLPRKDTRSRGTSMLELLAEKHDGDYRKAHLELADMILDMRNNSGNYHAGLSETVVAPVFNERAEITDIRIMMNKADKIKILHRENNGIKTMGGMEGAIVEKANQAEAFEDSIKVLNEDYKDKFHKEPESFVYVGEYTKDEQLNKENKELHEAWLHLPKKLQMEVEKSFGGKGFYVRKKAYRAVIGERDATAAQARLFGGDLVKSHKLRKMIRMIEKYWKKIITLEKVNIVIRTPEVLMVNMVSNSIALTQIGATPEEVIAKQYEGVLAVYDYIEKSEKLSKLKIRLSSQSYGTKTKRQVESEILYLEKELASNPMKELIDQGFLQSVVEDIDTSIHRYVDPNDSSPLAKAKRQYEQRVKGGAKKVAETAFL